MTAEEIFTFTISALGLAVAIWSAWRIRSYGKIITAYKAASAAWCRLRIAAENGSTFDEQQKLRKHAEHLTDEANTIAGKNKKTTLNADTKNGVAIVSNVIHGDINMSVEKQNDR